MLNPKLGVTFSKPTASINLYESREVSASLHWRVWDCKSQSQQAPVVPEYIRCSGVGNARDREATPGFGGRLAFTNPTDIVSVVPGATAFVI